MGDASFFLRIRHLIQASTPLLALSGGTDITFPVEPRQTLSLTTAGQSVLIGDTDWRMLSPRSDWIGGVRFTSDRYWCWNDEQRCLVGRP